MCGKSWNLCSALWLHFLQENSFSIMQRRTKRVPTNLGSDLVPVIDPLFSLRLLHFPLSLSVAIPLSPHFNASICLSTQPEQTNNPAFANIRHKASVDFRQPFHL